MESYAKIAYLKYGNDYDAISAQYYHDYPDLNIREIMFDILVKYGIIEWLPKYKTGKIQVIPEPSISADDIIKILKICPKIPNNIMLNIIVSRELLDDSLKLYQTYKPMLGFLTSQGWSANMVIDINKPISDYYEFLLLICCEESFNLLYQIDIAYKPIQHKKLNIIYDRIYYKYQDFISAKQTIKSARNI